MLEGIAGQTQGATMPVRPPNQGQGPKDLGYLQRIDGLRSGLDSVEYRLRLLAERIGGVSSDPKNQAKETPVGIPANLGMAEQHLRQIFQLLDMYEAAF